MDQNDTPQPPKGTATGWSNAAKRRKARRYGSNRIDQTPTTGPGYIVLDDTEDGDGGQAQIWDRS